MGNSHDPDRLFGLAREDVMRLYLLGEINWREAAKIIRVDPSTIARWTRRRYPHGFDWDEARDRWLHKRVDRLTVRREADLEAEL